MEHWWKDTDRGKQKYWEWSVGGMILTGGSRSTGNGALVE